jgi:hypothetical protein
MPYEVPTRWPLVETVSTRDGTLLKDARLVNAIAEFNPQTKTYTVQRRPGVVKSPISPIPSGTPQGLYSFNDALIQITGGNFYSNGVLYGSVFFGGEFTFKGSTSDANVLMLSRIRAGYYFINNLIFQQITDPNYPTITVPGIAYLNGRFYVMDPQGRIYGATNLDDASAWDPLNVIVAQQQAGKAIYLAQQLSYIVAIKANSAEVFWDSGQTATVDGSGSTLQPIPGSTVPYGCYDGGSVQEIDGTLIWMTSGLSGAQQIGRMDMLQFQIVSTPPVERILKTASAGATISFVLKLGGHRYYILQIQGIFGVNVTPVTLVFDLDQNLWYVWTDPSGFRPWPYYYSATNQFASPEVAVVQGTDGQIHTIQEDYLTPTDLGQPIPVDIYTPNYDADVDREKYMPALYLDSDITPGSKIAIRYSDDDYTTWTTPEEMDLSHRKPMITDLGSFYRRAFHIRHVAPTRFRIKNMGMTLGLGSL